MRVRDDALPVVGFGKSVIREAFLEEVAHALALELQLICEEQMADCFAGETGIQSCVIIWFSSSCHVSHITLSLLPSFLGFTVDW